MNKNRVVLYSYFSCFYHFAIPQNCKREGDVFCIQITDMITRITDSLHHPAQSIFLICIFGTVLIKNTAYE